MDIKQVFIYCLYSFIIPFICIAAGSLLPRIPYKKCTDSFWVEKARSIFPLRKYTITILIWLPLVNFFISFIIFPVHTYGTLKEMRLASTGITFLAAFCIHRYYSKQLGLRPEKLKDRINNILTYNLLLYPYFSIVIIAAIVMPVEFSGFLVIIFLIAVFLIILSFSGFTLLIGKVAGFIQPAPDNINALVKKVSETTGLPVPKGTYVIPWIWVNGFAFPLMKRIGITERALSELNDEELSALIAHELGHCAESPVIHLLRTVKGLISLLYAIAIPFIISFNFFTYVCLFYGCLIISGLISRVSKKMEQKADAVAMGVDQYKLPFAQALEKAAQINLMPVVLGSKRNIHGDLYDRLEKTGIILPYDKPKPPLMNLYNLGLLLAVVLDGVLLFLLTFFIF